MINLGRLATFAGLGAGKTFLGTVAAAHLMSYKEKTHNRFLIVAKKAIITEWTKQIPIFVPNSVAVFPDEGTINADFVVTNYEQIEKLIPYRKYFSGIIVDESHNFSNIGSQRFKNLMNFVDGYVNHRFILTGSPIQNKPDGLFTQLSFINPYAFNFSHEWMLKSMFTIRGFGARQTKFIKPHAKTIFASVVKKNSVLKNTPREGLHEVEPVTIPVPLSPTQRKYMQAVEAGHLVITKSGDTRKRGVLQELKNSMAKEFQVSSGFLYAGDGPIEFESEKINRAVDIASKTDERVIIWTYFQHTSERLKKIFKNEAECIVGGMSRKNIEHIKNRFERKEFRILIANIEAANAGLNLQFCRNAIFVEYSWAPVVIDQAVGRIDRPGQTRKCNIYFLYTEGTADELPIVAYHSKTTVNSKILTNFAKSRSIPPIRRKERKSNLGAIGL